MTNEKVEVEEKKKNTEMSDTKELTYDDTGNALMVKEANIFNLEGPNFEQNERIFTTQRKSERQNLQHHYWFRKLK